MILVLTNPDGPKSLRPNRCIAAFTVAAGRYDFEIIVAGIESVENLSIQCIRISIIE